ncbi:hypothetical protein [Paenibacillus sp. YAF4_2]|uniref:hypothetical protein n=1 Tax=Paenibacillus sp. YAF4_2 TaxID=3233085 RepID=UPI003F9B9643
MEINRVRNRLFGMLSGAVLACLMLEPSDERALMYSRIYFFALHGIIATYAHSEETVEQLMERLRETFEQTFEVFLNGLKTKLTSGTGNGG